MDNLVFFFLNKAWHHYVNNSVEKVLCNNRYLEKELYYENTKTASTTIVIEFNKKFEIVETYENDLDFKKGLKYFYYLFINKIKNKFKI